jgi:hypothetical protein
MSTALSAYCSQSRCAARLRYSPVFSSLTLDLSLRPEQILSARCYERTWFDMRVKDDH